ncbi:SRPBCC family protein [Agrococcus sp. ARC_14]|uniref:SRPBCC family protein n=1 Tax=Agrococcus sp. ARC_14 TaxID=2919927 RepID=UPI001F06DBBE|nr:SRPBCC family protein [Agrococcus sp. ARC_14]MCH1881493.1 SRPBCC family protein [Agrococcus sp. ARC_14]
MRTHYRFGHQWQVQASADAVRALLEDVRGYGDWWPGVRVVADASTPGRRAADLEVRAPLGYRIRITITEAPGRPDALRARITGDLEGWCTWRIAATPTGSRIVFGQQVEARSRLLRLLSPLLHHRLSGQHARVMRGAADGMRRALLVR